MAGEAEIVTDSGETSRKPLNLPDRPDPEIIIESATERRGAKRSDEEDAVAAAQRAAEEANARTAAANAERDAALAERDAAQARAGNTVVSERLQSITAQIDNLKAAIDGAKGRKRAARDAGNFEEEEAADEQRLEAATKLALLERDKQAAEADIERRKASGGQRQPGGEGGTRQPQISALEKQWLQDHPLFESDPAYQADVIGASQTAQSLGYMRGSPAFIKFVNERLTKLHGEGHGVASTHGKPQGRSRGGRSDQFNVERRPLSEAMPRSAETTDDFSAGGGVRYVDTDLGRVEMTTGPAGKPMIRFPNQRLKDMWADAAGWSGTHRDGTPKMTLADYAMEQIKIAEEQRQGLSGGITYDDERQVMR